MLWVRARKIEVEREGKKEREREKKGERAREIERERERETTSLGKDLATRPRGNCEKFSRVSALVLFLYKTTVEVTFANFYLLLQHVHLALSFRQEGLELPL